MEPEFMTQPLIIRKKKSVSLTKEERKSLKNFIKKFTTKLDCAEAIGIHRSVLDKVILSGTGAPETVQSIRLALGDQ